MYESEQTGLGLLGVWAGPVLPDWCSGVRCRLLATLSFCLLFVSVAIADAQRNHSHVHGNEELRFRARQFHYSSVHCV